MISPLVKKSALVKALFIRYAFNSKLPVFTTEDGIKTIKQFLGKLIDWKNIDDLIPKNFKSGSRYKRTGKAGIFAGSLELVKEGNVSIKQDNLFDDIYIKEIND